MHKYFGYGDFFCWHCGRRIHTGRSRCPHCGASYSSANYNRKSVKRRITTHPALGPLHPTAISYVVQYVLWSVLFALGWCLIMYYFMDVTFVDERRYVYYILWGFWAIWLLWFVVSKLLNTYKAYAKNNMARLGGTTHCCMCGEQQLSCDNYCSHCGTVIYVNHSEADQPPVEGKKLRSQGIMTSMGNLMSGCLKTVIMLVIVTMVGIFFLNGSDDDDGERLVDQELLDKATNLLKGITGKVISTGDIQMYYGHGNRIS